METKYFTGVYAESRNGANHFVRHWAVRKFQYSDGVEQCADAGLHWFLDIVATELPAVMRKAQDNFGVVRIVAKDGKADLTFELEDDAPPAWSRHINLTDLPDGEWTFFLADEGERFAFILPTEY